MKIEKEIKYTLSINEPDGHGIDYNKNLESDIAGLLISLTVLQTNLESLKATKKLVKGTDKKFVSQQISYISASLKGVKILVVQLCDNYETLIERK